MTLDDPDRSAGEVKCIEFELTGERFCVDILCVKEIRGWSVLTPLPHAAEHVLGALNLRGIVIPIVDFSGRIGLNGTDPTDTNVIIVLEVDNQTLGIVADSVSDILTLEGDKIQCLFEIEGYSQMEAIKGLYVREGDMIHVVRPSSILSTRNAVSL